MGQTFDPKEPDAEILEDEIGAELRSCWGDEEDFPEMERGDLPTEIPADLWDIPEWSASHQQGSDPEIPKATQKVSFQSGFQDDPLQDFYAKWHRRLMKDQYRVLWRTPRLGKRDALPEKGKLYTWYGYRNLWENFSEWGVVRFQPAGIQELHALHARAALETRKGIPHRVLVRAVQVGLGLRKILNPFGV